jgi:hypothetical protein
MREEKTRDRTGWAALWHSWQECRLGSLFTHRPHCALHRLDNSPAIWHAAMETCDLRLIINEEQVMYILGMCFSIRAGLHLDIWIISRIPRRTVSLHKTPRTNHLTVNISRFTWWLAISVPLVRFGLMFGKPCSCIFLDCIQLEVQLIYIWLLVQGLLKFDSCPTGQEIPCVYESWRLFAILTKAHHWFLSWAYVCIVRVLNVFWCVLFPPDVTQAKCVLVMAALCGSSCVNIRGVGCCYLVFITQYNVNN